MSQPQLLRGGAGPAGGGAGSGLGEADVQLVEDPVGHPVQHVVEAEVDRMGKGNRIIARMPKPACQMPEAEPGVPAHLLYPTLEVASD